MDSSTADSTLYQVSRRDRLFAVLTANVAVAFALAGWFGSQQYVLKVNFSRLLEVEMLRVKSKILTTRSEANPEQEAQQELDVEALQRQIAAAWVIARVWEYLMYVAAVILEAMAILAAIGRRPRVAHLVAALTILLSTFGTLEAIHLLVRPDFGGMQALPVRSYLYVGLLQGSYGAVLLAVLLTGRRPARR
jgi:hypothetical protein